MKKYKVEFTRELVTIELVTAIVEVDDDTNEIDLDDDIYLAIQAEDYVLVNTKQVTDTTPIDESEEIVSTTLVENEQ